jgi:beta-glucanase (GH16 family)
MSSSTANVSLDGAGHLAITPRRDASGKWTSGRIETQRADFAAPVGGKLAVEFSLQQPSVAGAAALGYWPAAWMLGAGIRGGSQSWPGIGEMDVMEDVNGLSAEFSTLHCGTFPGGPCHEPNGLGSGQRACAGCQAAFHTYRLEYDRSVSPEQLRWYLDGVNFFTLRASQVDATTWAKATQHSFFIILDLAMGGGFPSAFGGGPTAATASGVPLLVDYVRLYTASS